MKNINTWLPGFNGFYGSIYEPDETSEFDHINEIRSENNLDPVEFDNLDFDYDAYYEELSVKITEVVECELKSLELVKSVKFQELKSPREYNFTNDSINAAITPNTSKIRAYWTKHRDEWEQYLKDTYTSYDGFISRYRNNNWDIETILTGEHELGAFLNFAISNEDISELDIYEEITDIYIQCSNYEQAVSMEVKPTIPNILTRDLVIGCIEQINALRDYETRLDNWKQAGSE